MASRLFLFAVSNASTRSIDTNNFNKLLKSTCRNHLLRPPTSWTQTLLQSRYYCTGLTRRHNNIDVFGMVCAKCILHYSGICYKQGMCIRMSVQMDAKRSIKNLPFLLVYHIYGIRIRTTMLVSAWLRWLGLRWLTRELVEKSRLFKCMRD